MHLLQHKSLFLLLSYHRPTIQTSDLPEPTASSHCRCLPYRLSCWLLAGRRCKLQKHYLLNEFPCTSHKPNGSINNLLHNLHLLLRPRRIDNQILLRHQRTRKRHALSPLLRNDLLAVRRAETEMQGVVSTPNARMNVCYLPLSLLSDRVGCGDVVKEEERIAGFLEDRSLDNDVC